MELIQIFIPTNDREGRSFPPEHFEDLKKELTDQFDGVTIYAHAPARGIWKPETGSEQADNMVIYETLVQELDIDYWTGLKSRMEATFQQDEIMMRYFTVAVVK